jgi:hypothetical protein
MIGHNASMKRRLTGVRARLGRQCVYAVVGIAFGLAACAGDDDGSTSNSTASAHTTAITEATEPSPTAAPSTTVEASTSTGPPTTVGPTTAATSAPPPATPSSTDETPASTVLPSEAAVAEAARQLHSSWTNCLSTLPTCDAVTASTEYATGALSDLIYVQASSRNREGRRADQLETRTITVESVQVDAGAGTAAVVTCENDGTRALASDGSVVNDAYVSRRFAYTFLWNGDRWLGATRVEQQRADGVGNGLCTPAG